MSHFVFQTADLAELANQNIAANVRAWVQANMPEAVTPDGYLRGRNAATGELTDAVTTRWDEPRALADGRFAILKPSAERVAPMPLEAVLDGIAATEITQAEYEAAMPKPEMP